MATDNERFPVGSRVRPTVAAHTMYARRFPLDRLGSMRGVVIEGDSIHVDWGVGFEGHNSIDHPAGYHNTHCWYMDHTYIELVTGEDVVEPIQPEQTVMPAMIPRLRVTITRATDNRYEPWGLTVDNGPVPNKTEVQAYIDRKSVV